MADQADKRLRALRASMKIALGKLTGSDALEAEGVRERSGRSADEPTRETRAGARAAPPARKSATRGTAKARSPRRP